jgi:hypothetical protein
MHIGFRIDTAKPLRESLENVVHAAAMIYCIISAVVEAL